jgi:hypothetical protein
LIEKRGRGGFARLRRRKVAELEIIMLRSAQECKGPGCCNRGPRQKMRKTILPAT